MAPVKLALDTNAYSFLVANKGSGLQTIVEQAELIILPFVVDAELRAGFRKGSRKLENYRTLQRFQSLDRVQVAWPDQETNELYAQIWEELATNGTPIPTNDIWIAAICIQQQCQLATRDAHFDKVPLLDCATY